jgi:hypothetical protein
VPDRVSKNAPTELSSGSPFSDADLEQALDDASVAPQTAQAITDENTDSRLRGPSVVGRDGVCRIACVVLQPPDPGRASDLSREDALGFGAEVGDDLPGFHAGAAGP